MPVFRPLLGERRREAIRPRGSAQARHVPAAKRLSQRARARRPGQVSERVTNLWWRFHFFLNL